MRKLMVAAVLLFFPAFAHAQAPLRINRFAVDAPRPFEQPSSSSQGASTPAMVAGGLAGGVIGFFGAGYAGVLIASDPNDSGEGLEALAGFVIGATLGESLLLPVGVHLVNHRRGKLLPAMLASAGIGIGGVALAAALGDGAAIILPLTPVAQLISSIAIERASAR